MMRIVTSYLLKNNRLNTIKRCQCLIVNRFFSSDNKNQNGNGKSTEIPSIFKPVPIKDVPVNEVGKEMVGELEREKVLTILNSFSQRKQIRELCIEFGIDDKNIQQTAINSFRTYCLDMERLPTELYIKLFDICHGATHQDDLFPYFLNHTKQIFPHLECMGDLKRISDLKNPANWYPEARQTKRKIVFHGGPTNSGKTYQAMQRFMSAGSGVYCGPLKMLAVEVFQRCNKLGTPCDLITGEERRMGNEDGTVSNHVACTVEMTALNRRVEVAVLDEIQQVKDINRGWAWTRAFLGVPADEIHVCGEAGTLELLEKICLTTGEKIEVNNYDRLTQMTVEDKALESYDNLQPGDCIVCFNKNDLYNASLEIESLGHEVAVIYGSLPPNTKITQAAKFNDPNDKCKIMVATDAIGMGLNLSIRRIIFYSMIKMNTKENGETGVSTLSVSTTLQIAGRAGRYGTQWEHGYVTTLTSTDLPTLQYLMQQKPEPIVKAGLHPTADQIELYSYYLPQSPLMNIMEIFESLCVMDDLYFMCQTDDFKFLADTLHHIALPLRARYMFCCAPINRKSQFLVSMFTKFATQYSLYKPITYEYVAEHCGFPLRSPKTLAELIQLEAVFDALDLYCWLSYRFVEMFPHKEEIQDAQTQIDLLIQGGVRRLTTILRSIGNFTEIKSNRNSKVTPVVSEEDPQANDEPIRPVKKLISANLPATMMGPMTAHVLSEGLLTSAMLNQLHNEWLHMKINKAKQIKTAKKAARKEKEKK